MQSDTYLVVEGQTDLVVLKRLLQDTGFANTQDRESGGKRKILANIHKYNEAAQFANWIVVLDLDQDADCAPDYLRNLNISPATGMTLRIAVHSMEAWLMADSGMMAQFLQIPANNFPAAPDLEIDPKGFLIRLIRHKCRRRQLLQDMLPYPQSRSKVGPGYLGRISEYVQNHWRPEVAAGRSDSLARCIRALEDLKRQSAR